jgi:hypothetical protein
MTQYISFGNLFCDRTGISYITNYLIGLRGIIYPLMFHTECPVLEFRFDKCCERQTHHGCELRWISLYREGWCFKGRTSVHLAWTPSLKRGRRGGELGDEVIGRLSWFPYKAPTIALWQRQLITKVTLTALFSPFCSAYEAHQRCCARMNYILGRFVVWYPRSTCDRFNGIMSGDLGFHRFLMSRIKVF